MKLFNDSYKNTLLQSVKLVTPLPLSVYFITFINLVLSELDKILISAHRDVIIKECPNLISSDEVESESIVC